MKFRPLPGLLAPSLCLSLCLFSGSLARAASDWTSFRGDAGQSGVAEGSLPASLDLAWTFEAGSAIASSPVVADGLVYFGSDDGKLYAVHAASGEKAWELVTEDIIEAPPMVHGGRVFVGSSDGYLYAADAKEGTLLWKGATEDKILGGASWVPDPEKPEGPGRVLVGSYDNRLYCFAADTGTELWRYETQNYINGTPALHDGKVVFGGCDAVLHVVAAADGSSKGKVPLADDCHIAGSVALVDGRAYFGHYGNAFVCIELGDETNAEAEAGTIVWEYKNPRHAFFSAPAIGRDRVVFGGRDRKVHCVNRETGEGIWTHSTRRKVDSSPVICGDKVLCASGDGRIYLLSLEDGTELWSYEIGEPIFSSPALADGRVFLGANDGRLYAFAAPQSEEGESQ